MLWKPNAERLSLVINQAPYPEGSGEYRRQKYCMDVLKESAPKWVYPRFSWLTADRADSELGLDSLFLGEEPALPNIREMMLIACLYGNMEKDRDADWLGVSVSDLIFTPSVWPAFQESGYQIMIVRASQIPDLPEGARVTAVPIKKWNVLSMDALFIRGKAIPQFFNDYPDVFLAEYWDDATQAWARRHRRLGIRVLDNHETMHKVHTPKWEHGVRFTFPGSPQGLRSVGVYNRAQIAEFKKIKPKK